MRGIIQSAGLVAAMCANFMVSVSYAANTDANPQASSSLNQKIAQIEETESKWKGPDPKLAEETKALGFAKDLGQQVANALKRDVPGAVLGLQEVVQKAKGGPNQKQKKWLASQISLLTPDALTILTDAFKNAKSVLDLRGMLIARTVAVRIKKDAIPGSHDQFAEVLQQSLGDAAARYYWSVTNVSGSFIGETYSEQTLGGTASIAAKQGQKLLRVRATIKNTSAGSDLPYVLGIFEGIKGVLAPFQAETINGVQQEPATAGPHRWLDDTLVVLVNASGEFIQCGFVVQGSDLRGGLEVASGGIGIVIGPKAIKSMAEVRFDGIFPIPEQSQDVRLLVFGAAPARVPIATSGQK